MLLTHAYSHVIVLPLPFSALLCCCMQCVIGFGAACTNSPAYSSASFTTPPTPESPLVLSNLPSSTVYNCCAVASNAGGSACSSTALVLATATFKPNPPSMPRRTCAVWSQGFVMQ
jgi:hypothetical protein